MTPLQHSSQQYHCLPLPGLHQHLASSGVQLGYQNWPTAGSWGAEWDSEFDMDPALGELRQHLQRHGITFVVFDMDLTVTARHTRGHLTRDPETMAAYLASARVTDALKVCMCVWCFRVGLVCITTMVGLECLRSSLRNFCFMSVQKNRGW